MKNILALMHDDSGQEARYQVALDVTRALEGHLTCLDLTYIPPMTSGIYESAYVMVDVLTQESTREEANRARMKRRLEHEDVSWNWVDVTGDAAQTLRQAATLADLI
ncbi:MAG: universal stress protein, partial [Sphingomonas parapaucimobilis]